MKGSIGEREGMFPVNFVKVLEELPKQEQHSVSGIAGPRDHCGRHSVAGIMVRGGGGGGGIGIPQL